MSWTLICSTCVCSVFGIGLDGAWQQVVLISWSSLRRCLRGQEGGQGSGAERWAGSQSVLNPALLLLPPVRSVGGQEERSAALRTLLRLLGGYVWNVQCVCVCVCVSQRGKAAPAPYCCCMHLCLCSLCVCVCVCVCRLESWMDNEMGPRVQSVSVI